MTKQEKEFKAAFRHKNVTNAIVVGKHLKVYYRYKTRKDFLSLRNQIMDTAFSFDNLNYIKSAAAMSTKNYEYSVIIFRID